jgi:hypothetical protein
LCLQNKNPTYILPYLEPRESGEPPHPVYFKMRFNLIPLFISRSRYWFRFIDFIVVRIPYLSRACNLPLPFRRSVDPNI